MIGLFADGGGSAGLGHLTRCLALAEAFQTLGRRPRFVGLRPECRDVVRRAGFTWAPLGRSRWDVLVADSYRVARAELAAMRRRAKTLAAFDDDGSFAAPCDWVLNGHLYASSLAFRAPAGAGFLLGAKFLPMRRAYWPSAPRRTAPRRIRELLVTVGGGDSEGLATRVVRAALAALPGAQVHVVTGPFARPFESPLSGRVRSHHGVPSLRPLLMRCDAAVSAAGQTLYEAARVGTPTLSFSLAPNQRGNLDSLASAGVLSPLGEAAGAPSRLVRALRALDAAPARRAEMGARGPALFDGKGALRVARVLLDGGE